MAEAVVSIALETFRHLLLEEGRFLSGVGDEVKELETQLKEVKCLLEDADRRRHQNRSIFNWISEIRDLVYRAESAIERHAAYQVSLRRRRGLRHLVRRCSSVFENCHSLHQLGSEISKIKSNLERISNKMQENGIKKSIITNPHGAESSATNNNRLRMAFPDFEIGDCFLGMEDELKRLVHLLGQDEEERVISVWGMGGSGKTTIARKLYNETAFDLSAWVCVTQQCRFRAVWEDVLKQLELQNREGVSTLSDGPQTREDVPSLSERELIERLCRIQREKRCLIVLDDLWELSHWNALKHPFNVLNLQTKILITTREQGVAHIGSSVKLGPLSAQHAWELLKKQAFPHTKIPEFALKEDLEKIGKEMVQKCGYLPLAVSLLGGVLRMKKSKMEWELVNEDIKDFIFKEKQIDGVLNLSYESLPYYLKPCFLYMGIFKEDVTIIVRDLYLRWIAQGMISDENIGGGDKEETLMEIAELYLCELASRSIVQVEMDDDFDVPFRSRKFRSCKLHDVVRELCLKLGKREDFGVHNLEYQGGRKLTTLLQEASSHMKIRHLTIHFTREVDLKPDHELAITCGEDTGKHLRSLQISNHIIKFQFPQQSIFDFHKFKLLRSLIIVGFKFAGRKLPRGITNLVHLRCLRFEKCDLDNLPSSIRNLVYMDTLDLSGSWNVGVPNVFKEMLRLRHLFFPFYKKEKIGNSKVSLDEGVDELESLLRLDSRLHELKCMDRMENLRRFSAHIHDNDSLSAIVNVIATKWNKLVYCGVMIEGNCEFSRSEQVLKKVLTCPNLHDLGIHCKLGRAVPECGVSDLISSKLTVLSLYGCEIEHDPMGILGKLPCLIELSLRRGSFVGEEMTTPINTFLRLKMLLLIGLPKLREWRVEAGAMPLLSQLHIHDCNSLEMLPHGLSDISTLQELEISRMPELGKRASPSGLDFHKVSHVPSIIIQL